MCGSIPSSRLLLLVLFCFEEDDHRLFLRERKGGVKFFCLQHACVKKFEIKNFCS